MEPTCAGNDIRLPDLANISNDAKAALRSIKDRCDEEGPCWLWKRSVNSSGYPQIRMDGNLKMVRQYVLCDLLGVELPPGWWASTDCRNKRCCSPACLMGMRRGAVMERSYAAGARLATHGYSDRLSMMVLQGMTKLGFEGARFVRGAGVELSDREAGRVLNVSRETVARARRGESWRQLHPQASVFAWAATA
ncbi:MAG: hypothetical protein E6R08_00420 [Nevskiaceae bacterium]|nr:MAG: hypothetical protein E6R08_00420 [Nevskiaceae bacterium]